MHPTKEQAAAGFARENAAGVDLGAAERNYKDDNHKPEVALTDFWMLHGFQPLDQMAAALRKVPELCSIMPDFSARLVRAGDATQARRDLLRDLHHAVMTMPQERVDLLLNALVDRLATGARSDKDGPDYWVARAAETFPPVGGHRDRGIFSIYLLNLVHLRPGQGTFQPAGTLHAYLEGVAVELMASSDNVLRGGLTRKHVDVSELMGILSFDDGTPQGLDGESAGSSDRVYRTPSDGFELSCLDLPTGGQYLGQAAHGPDSIIVLDGAATLTVRGRSILLARRAFVFVPFGTHYSLDAGATPAMLFKASVPGRPILSRLESSITDSAAALVRERVKVAPSRFQMTRIYQTRDRVENSLAGSWIVSPSLEERVQIEHLCTHLAEYPQYSERRLVHSSYSTSDTLLVLRHSREAGWLSRSL